MSDQLNPAEPAAPEPVPAESAGNAYRRGQAVVGALAGVAVIALLVAVWVIVRVGGDDDTPAAAPPPVAAPAAPGPRLDPELQRAPVVKAGTGDLTELEVTSLVKGTGPKVRPGQRLTVNYVGVTYRDGREFDSSWKRNQPAQFQIGAGQLIKGWDRGLVGVPVGSRVQLDIPAGLAYGDHPSGGRPAGDLRFVVDVLQAG